LWKTDGSAAGTTLVTPRELGLGGAKPTEWELAYDGVTPSNLTNVGGTLFFSAADGVHGPELWKSDGTDAGTVMVKDIQPGPAGSAPGWLTEMNGVAYFTADDGTHGRQLWRSDGTSAGTFQVGTVADDPGNLSPAELLNLNGVLFFAADTAAGNPQVWRSDGTAGGTMAVSNEPFQPPQFYRSSSMRLSISYGSPVLSAASADTLFAVNRKGVLFRHDASGWTFLHDQIAYVSAVTPAAGPDGAVVFAVTMDGGLLRYDDVSGWQTIGAPHTIYQMSAGTDVNGRADAYVLTANSDFTVFSDSSGWSASLIGGRGSVYGISAGANGRVAVKTNDASIFEYDPRTGWFRLTDRNFASDISLTTDAAGHEVLYALTPSQGLFRHDFASGWQRLGADGTITSIAAGVDAAGKTTVVAFTTAGDAVEHDDLTGWSLVQAPDRLWETASPMPGGEFFLLDDGSVLARDASGLYTRLSSPGFDP
jgi:ELWxxDGT repeat protein